MVGVMGKLLRALVYTAATVVIALALVVGLIRLLLPQLTEYQQEVRDAAAAATGFSVDFAQLSASWPLRGRCAEAARRASRSCARTSGCASRHRARASTSSTR